MRIKRVFMGMMLFFFFWVSLGLAEEFQIIKDQFGREVKIPKKIERVVAINGALRYVVYLQAMEKVVGVEAVEKRGLMKGLIASGKPYWSAIKDRVKDLPEIGEGGPGKYPDVEKLLKVKPDLIIALEPDMADSLMKNTGIPVVVIKHAGTSGFDVEENKETFLFLGRLLGKSERAKSLCGLIDSYLSDLKKRGGTEQKFSFYVGAISARGPHGITSTQAKYPPFSFLGIKTPVDTLKEEGHLFIDKERLLLMDPDYIFIDTGGLSIVSEDYKKNPSFYEALKAIKNKKVYTLYPSNFYRTNVEVIFANAYFIGKVLFPEKFKDIDPHVKAREIIKNFVGKDVYEELKRNYPGFKQLKFEGGSLIFN